MNNQCTHVRIVNVELSIIDWLLLTSHSNKTECHEVFSTNKNSENFEMKAVHLIVIGENILNRTKRMLKLSRIF